ncbi:hypothetical protein [Streptomyces sp. NBC_01304]|uniref:hypothetical protein n=1 Tax=Streptomyces sp. NBC_01304 TaxID=2903818 RepID=UPI002E10F3A1|nr:hypothetical protein OG430_46005 [Streptomyces sp. NBC_01304]
MVRPDGPDGSTLRVDDAKLNEASNNLVELRGDTDKVDNTAHDDTLNAVSGLNRHGAPDGGAWDTAHGLFEMDTRWAHQVGNLKGMLQSISEKIHDTRGNYTRREQHEQAKNDRSMMSDFG